MQTKTFLPILLAIGEAAFAQRPGGPPLTSLKAVPVPTVPGLEQYVRDEKALVVLGKALFWDMQAGSDGKTACASCHFHAGADHRVQNQLAPPHTSTAGITPNRTLTAADFPFHRPGNLGAPREVAGSAGTFQRSFFDVVTGAAEEDGADLFSNRFNLNGRQTRQVTSRNTPSVINAVFNVRNFWDGRASNIFNGVSPGGDEDSAARVLAWRDGQLAPERVRLVNSSLASQAVGPVLNEIEMSYTGRNFTKVAEKLLALRPLGRQAVSAEDSVLGDYADPSGVGLAAEHSYRRLIETAFDPAYWAAPEGNQMVANFSLYWGLAIQAYEATLISNDSRLDQFLEGNTQALTTLEQQGMREFLGGGSQCTQCHQGAEFTGASFSNTRRPGFNPANPRDAGFFRTAVTPIEDDPGFGNGAFKSPGLRNVEFTGPYFHDGGQATLEQVMDFYARNGDFRAGGNLGPGIGQIRLNPQERTAVVAFMKALTDDRVRYQRAPFDHPSLCIPTGHEEAAEGILAADTTDGRFASSALDRWALIPAVGRNGDTAPLQTFDELLRGIGNDGSRAHNLTQACAP
jgi:cytochrome c peroxidase